METKKRNNPATELSKDEIRLICDAIRVRGWTRSRFARRAKIALSTAQQYLSRERSPSVKARTKIARALGLDVTEAVVESARIIER